MDEKPCFTLPYGVFAICCLQQPAGKQPVDPSSGHHCQSAHIEAEMANGHPADHLRVVIYDPVSNFIYVSNINGQPWDQDGNGFISKLDLDGKIVERQWVTGLSAPKGLGIHNGHLL